ncbi:hypothetical protein HWV62_17092 [Athelia sp. TMB]|nr:hypothetical protein HWV62_17092 [Athelia sp. TMB]
MRRVAYCSSEHQSVDWAAHKIECRLSKSIPKGAEAGFERIDTTDNKSPLSKIIFPLRQIGDESLAQEHQHFVTYDNPMDRIKPRGKPSQRAKNIYGPGERFIVVSTMHIVDRPYSVSILLQRKTGMMPDVFVMSPNMQADETDSSVAFDALVNVIKASEEGKAEVAFFWATRRGDCIEIEMVDIPDQSLGW